MAIFALAWKSLLNRRFTALLTVTSIALSVALLVGVERLRTEARESFANTLSGTDLIIGARSGPVQLLLYAVFRIGDATNNFSWKSYQDIAEHPKVSWTVPIALGDSHRGFRVLGTTPAYFEHYRYARNRPLEIAEGQQFSDLFDAVVGAEVAEKLLPPGRGRGKDQGFTACKHGKKKTARPLRAGYLFCCFEAQAGGLITPIRRTPLQGTGLRRRRLRGVKIPGKKR